MEKMAANTTAELPDMTGLDQDVSRLMDEAGAHMDDPATSGQRETYSHLRTAVAATEALFASDCAIANSSKNACNASI